MEDNKKWGGKREGAGRPKAVEGIRAQHQLRAFDDEWDLIRRFAKIVKHVDKQKCAEVLAQLENE